jgi:hypothetical protein
MSDIKVIDTCGRFQLCKILNDAGDIVGYCIRCDGLASSLILTLAEAEAMFERRVAGEQMSKAAALMTQQGGVANMHRVMGNIRRSPVAATPAVEPEDKSAANLQQVSDSGYKP